MPENTEKSNPAPGKKETEGARGVVNADCPPPKNCGTDEFKSREDLDGKSDSGPEPEVHGREIPPQD